MPKVIAKNVIVKGLNKMPDKENRREKNRLKREAFFNEAEIWWDRLDNTAHIFPVIAGEKMSNVYRLSVFLKEDIDPVKLQEALDLILPQFKGFNVRLRQGIFWYYFEENGKMAPRVKEESAYPCRFIVQNTNRSYLFRVSYYKRKINLEVFHVLTDGMGGINFLKELTYQYLRLVHPELREKFSDDLSSDTSMNREDSFLSNFKKMPVKRYHSQRAYLLKGLKLKNGEFGIMHGYMKTEQLKEVCRRYGASINEYLVAVFAWSIYTEFLRGVKEDKPIRIAVPVNLRGYFDSITTKNFFVMVSAEFKAENESYAFEEIVNIIKDSLRGQISKEKLEKIISYNVSNEKNLLMRAIPLEIKKIAIYYIYRLAALANTTTVSNIGNISLKEEYAPYVEKFNAIVAMSKGQNLKGLICSYQDTLVFTFSSYLADPSVQRRFFRKLADEGIEVSIESNGVYYE